MHNFKKVLKKIEKNKKIKEIKIKTINYPEDEEIRRMYNIICEIHYIDYYEFKKIIYDMFNNLDK